MCATSFLSRPALLVLFSCALFSTALGQGENSGFPVYKDTGNPQKDAADYTQRKQAWIKANPLAYQTIGGQVEAVPTNPVPNPPMTHTVSAGYVTNLPKEKEVVPTSVNPNIQQKEEMLYMSAIPLLQNTPTTLPANFPQLQNTGNASKDEADLARAKAEWIKENPERYKEYLESIAIIQTTHQIGLNTSDKSGQDNEVLLTYEMFLAYPLDMQNYVINHLQEVHFVNLPKELQKGAIMPKLKDYKTKVDFDFAYRIWSESNEH